MRSYSSLIGYALVIGFFYLAIMKGTNNPSLFFNVHAIGIVVGGVLIASLASFPFSVLWRTLKSVVRNLHIKARVNPEAAQEMVTMAESYRRGLSALEKTSETIKTPFIRDGANLILEGIKGDVVLEILEKRIDQNRSATTLQMNVLLTLSRYSPALGLGATVLGLVDLLSQLQAADLGALGTGMAIALCGTFYGILLSNMIFMPLSELISSGGEFEAKEDEMIMDGYASMLSGQDPLIVGEVVNSYLQVQDRIDFTDRRVTGNKMEQRASA